MTDLKKQFDTNMECIKHHKHITEDNGNTNRLLKIKCLEPTCQNEGFINKRAYYALREKP